MSEPKLHIIKGDLISKEDLFAYIQNTVSDAEKLRIENSIHKDPFLQDAVEGLQGADIHTIEAALTSIYGKVDAITATKKPQIFSTNLRKYAAAASIILLLGMAWVIVDNLGSKTNENKIAVEPSINAMDKNPAVIDDSSDMGGGSALADSMSMDEIKTESNNQFAGATKTLESVARSENVSEAEKTADMNKSPEFYDADIDIVEDETSVFSQTHADNANTSETITLNSGATYPGNLSEINTKVTTTDAKKDSKVKDKKSKESKAEYNSDMATGDDAETVEVKVYDFVEVMPQFPGGTDSLNAFISHNLKSNCKADNDCAAGYSFVRFIVQANGSVSDAEVVKTDDIKSNTNVLDVVNKMPDWTPGMHSNEAVDVWYTIKIEIRY